MSPEQAAGRSLEVDHRTDIYSLGVTLYELLTLCPAIRGDDGPDLLRKIEQHEPLRPRALSPDLPGDLEAVVQKAIAKARQERYPTAAALAEDLQRFLDGLPTVARPHTFVDQRGSGSGTPATHESGGCFRRRLPFRSARLHPDRLASKRPDAAGYEAAEANLCLAQANYRQAREAVDRFGAQLAEELAEVPGRRRSAAGCSETRCGITRDSWPEPPRIQPCRTTLPSPTPRSAGSPNTSARSTRRWPLTAQQCAFCSNSSTRTRPFSSRALALCTHLPEQSRTRAHAKRPDGGSSRTVSASDPPADPPGGQTVRSLARRRGTRPHEKQPGAPPRSTGQFAGGRRFLPRSRRFQRSSWRRNIRTTCRSSATWRGH